MKGFITDIFLDTLDAPPGHRIETRIDQRDAPRLRLRGMVLGDVLSEIDRHVGLVHVVVMKISLM